MFCLKCYNNAFQNADKERKIIKLSIILNDFSWPKIIINDLEKLEYGFDLCENCDNKVGEEMIKISDDVTLDFYIYSLFLLKKLYIKSIKAALFFNFITSQSMLHHTQYLMRENENFYIYLHNFLIHTYGYDYKIFSNCWKGTNYYYQLLFDSYLNLEEPLPVKYFDLSLVRDLPIV